MKKAIYTLLNIVEFCLACYGAGYLLEKYTDLENPFWVGKFLCIVAGCIVFYFYHVKDKPEEKENEPFSMLKDAVRETSLQVSISEAVSQKNNEEKDREEADKEEGLDE